jgi:hypothetical protein
VTSGARILRTGAAIVALAAATECALWLASLARPRLTIDVGPATGPYTSGMSPSVEFPPVTARWLRSGARIALPLDVVAGGGQVLMHLVAGPETLSAVPFELRLAGRSVARFDVPPTSAARQAPLPERAPNDPLRDTRIYGVPAVTDGGPLVLQPAGAPVLGVDWFRLEGFRYVVPARAPAVRLFGPGVFALALALGLGRLRALAAALAAVALSALCLALDPFLAVHLAAKVALPGIALALPAAFVLRRHAWGPGLAFVLLGGFVLKGAGLFHPGLHAPDALLHTRYVAAFRETQGDLAQRGRAAQRAAGVAFPRSIGGREYVMPYSPVFYLPFTLLPTDRVAGAMKYAVLLASVLQTAVVFALARAVQGDDRVALAAALLHTFTAPPFHRLVWAMWPATAGHLADLLALAALLSWLRDPASRRRFASLAGAVLLSFTAYISGLVLVGTLLAAAALVVREHARRLLLLATAAGCAAAALVYWPFVVDIWTGILPSLRAGASAAVEDPGSPPWTALARIPLFYGWAFPLVAAAGLFRLSRTARPTDVRWVHAYVLAVVLLLALRSATGVVLRDLKDALFAAPLLALLATGALSRLAALGRHARWVAVGVGVGLGLQGLALYWTYLTPRLALAAPG